jgi:hypothetical protein
MSLGLFTEAPSFSQSFAWNLASSSTWWRISLELTWHTPSSTCCHSGGGWSHPVRQQCNCACKGGRRSRLPSSSCCFESCCLRGGPWRWGRWSSISMSSLAAHARVATACGGYPSHLDGSRQGRSSFLITGQRMALSDSLSAPFAMRWSHETPHTQSVNIAHTLAKGVNAWSARAGLIHRHIPSSKTSQVLFKPSWCGIYRYLQGCLTACITLLRSMLVIVCPMPSSPMGLEGMGPGFWARNRLPTPGQGMRLLNCLVQGVRPFVTPLPFK